MNLLKLIFSIIYSISIVFNFWLCIKKYDIKKGKKGAILHYEKRYKKNTLSSLPKYKSSKKWQKNETQNYLCSVCNKKFIDNYVGGNAIDKSLDYQYVTE